MSHKTGIDKPADQPKAPARCRIPQRLPVNRLRALPLKAKQIPDAAQTRPKSASRKDESPQARQIFSCRAGSARPADRTAGAGAVKAITLKQVYNKQKAIGKNHRNGLPDQETISKREILELQREMSDLAEDIEEDPFSRSERITELKDSWQRNLIVYDQLKFELHDRQNLIIELYSKLRATQQKMSGLGEVITLPSAEELRVMNVNHMSPSQLLRLCSAKATKEDAGNNGTPKNTANSSITLPHTVSVDVAKAANMPNKLVAMCEEVLVKRKEIIDWFDTLKSEEKGIQKGKLLLKIKEFYAENEMLENALQNVKGDFLRETGELVCYLKNCFDEAMALQLRSEQMTYEISELHSTNADLRKQLQAADQFKSTHTKHKIEELEKELKDEKCKRMLMSNRLNRSEVQVKRGTEQIAQLETTLEQTRSQAYSLERTVRELNQQNQKLQNDFDSELNKLTESIRENTMQLEEIAQAREKLQTEKEDLEKRLRELSEHYNESMNTMRLEMKANVAKLIETEEKREEESEERKKLENKLECICAQLLEAELRYKEMIKQTQEKDSQIARGALVQSDLDTAKRDLATAHRDIEEYRNRLMKQTDTIREIERDFEETVKLDNKLKQELHMKEDYISELEKKQSLLEQQLQDSESKMSTYQEQLADLKEHIAQLQQDFGEFENISELHDMINQQRAKLLEATRQNGELAEALQKKDIELERNMETLTDQEHVLEQKNGIIKMLSDKDEEQSNIIKLLRNNLELRVQADNELSEQIHEKTAEVDALTVNINTRKLQISQMEKIILTLEDQLRNINVQRRKDQDKITLLEQTISEYEAYHMETKRSIEAPAENLDNLIKMLEDELGPAKPLNEVQRTFKQPEYRKRDKHYDYEGVENTYQSENDKIPTKIVMGNFVKKTYLSTNEDQYKGDSLDRKKAITNMESPKWYSTQDPTVNYTNASQTPMPTKDYAFRGVSPPSDQQERQISRNIQLLMSNQMRDEKKCKMFKLAGHRI